MSDARHILQFTINPDYSITEGKAEDPHEAICELNKVIYAAQKQIQLESAQLLEFYRFVLKKFQEEGIQNDVREKIWQGINVFFNSHKEKTISEYIQWSKSFLSDNSLTKNLLIKYVRLYCKTLDRAYLEKTIDDFFSFSKRQEQDIIIKNATSAERKINHVVKYDDHTGGCELWGHRKTQEDRMLAGKLSLESKVPLDWQAVLELTISDLQREASAKLGKLADDNGCCVCVNIVTSDTVYTANLGDATSHLVYLPQRKAQAPQREAQVRVLHKLHDHTNAEERERLEELGSGFNKEGRVLATRTNAPSLTGTLQPSRSIGDNNVCNLSGQPLISHEPDITKMTIPQSGSVFLVTACDGLTDALSEKDILNIIEGHANSYIPAHLASTLALQALNKGSQDNISVLVSQVSRQNLGAQKISYTAVFDGHGRTKGDCVSEFLYKNFQQTLDNNIQLVQQLTNNITSIETSDPDIKQLQNKNKNKPFGSLISFCAKKLDHFQGWFTHTTFFRWFSKPPVQTELLYSALANLKANKDLFPLISNTKELLIAEQKRQAALVLQQEITRLKKELSDNAERQTGYFAFLFADPTFEPKITKKILAYEYLLEKVLDVKCLESLYQILSTALNHEWLKNNTALPTDKEEVPSNISSVKSILVARRGDFKESNARTILNKLLLMPDLSKLEEDFSNFNEILNIVVPTLTP